MSSSPFGQGHRLVDHGVLYGVVACSLSASQRSSLTPVTGASVLAASASSGVISVQVHGRLAMAGAGEQPALGAGHTPGVFKRLEQLREASPGEADLVGERRGLDPRPAAQ